MIFLFTCQSSGSAPPGLVMSSLLAQGRWAGHSGVSAGAESRGMGPAQGTDGMPRSHRVRLKGTDTLPCGRVDWNALPPYHVGLHHGCPIGPSQAELALKDSVIQLAPLPNSDNEIT